jgi:small subunit ribosomal protein S6
LATKVYEGMFLLDSNRYARDPGGVSGQITQIVENCGGEILASRLWSEQKLAYSIEGHRKGTYWLTYFRMDSVKQPELARACRLNENILRNLVIRIDDRLVDTLVRHAQSTNQPVGVAEGAKVDDRSAKDEVKDKDAKEQDTTDSATEES